MCTRTAASLVLVVIVTALLAAQSDRGEIAGTVRDTSGGVLPGVTVELSGTGAIQNTRRTVTDRQGAYRFTALVPGAYRLTFTLAGFTAEIRENVVVAAGAPVPLNVEMHVGQLAETISVTGKAPVKQTTMSSRAIARDSGAPPLPPPAHHGHPVIALPPRHVPDSESYAFNDDNPFHHVTSEPLSTFSIDTDTASYANVRRFLNDGTLPPAAAVRIEELVNYFRFDYSQPSGSDPFSMTTELAECPWNPAHRLLLVGLRGRDVPAQQRAPGNLVFLIDVSGSMTPPDRLPLIRNAMRMLVDALRPSDRVAIVVYAGSSGLVLPSTPGSEKATIHEAIARLEAGGSTNGGAGIRLAYRVARENFIAGGVNRVILATDGDFNVGTTRQDELVRLIEEERRSGVFLSVLGVGRGNLKDSTMEQLSNRGNGNYAYLDSLHEARKALISEGGGTLVTIAKDVKIQIEFNPAAVSAYRLIGYENRLLRNEDFNDDSKDAGEIGAGHTVTAIYEIVPAGAALPPSVDPLRYQRLRVLEPTPAAKSDELLTLKLRYKAPDGDDSRLIATMVRNQPQAMTRNLGFASAVAEFGMLLRASPHRGSASYASAAARARTFRGDDPEGYRAEFVRLVDLASGVAALEGRREDARR